MTGKRLQQIPTNLVLGFLGCGKTTAILHLLKHKPVHEKWAVLVNEFGQVGLDGAIYRAAGVTVKEVAGGCLCCAVGLPFQVSVNQLLKQARPDRLLIEPTGLGHPDKVLTRLLNDIAPGVLDVKATICLVDPRHLLDSRYTEHETFIDQMAVADVLVANKTDLASDAAMQAFYTKAQASQPAKTLVAETRFGQLATDWLDICRNTERRALYPEAHSREQSSLGEWQTQGEVFDTAVCFDKQKLQTLFEQLSVARIKAVVRTGQGWFVFNGTEGQLTVQAINADSENRIEWIGQGESMAIKTALQRCMIG